jgi:hypothetical protein
LTSSFNAAYTNFPDLFTSCSLTLSFIFPAFQILFAFASILDCGVVHGQIGVLSIPSSNQLTKIDLKEPETKPLFTLLAQT